MSRRGDIERARQEMAANEDGYDRQRLEDSLALMNVPRKHWHVSMQRIPDRYGYREKIVSWHERYLAARAAGTVPVGLYLHGPPGSGKSAIGSGILRWATRRRIGGYFLPAARLIDVARDNPPLHPTLSEGVWDFVRRVDLLVFDDLLRGYSENSFGQLLLIYSEELLRTRLAAGCATVITSNRAAGRLAAISPSLANVIEEACYDLEIAGVDYRHELQANREPL